MADSEQYAPSKREKLLEIRREMPGLIIFPVPITEAEVNNSPELLNILEGKDLPVVGQEEEGPEIHEATKAKRKNFMQRVILFSLSLLYLLQRSK